MIAILVLLLSVAAVPNGSASGASRLGVRSTPQAVPSFDVTGPTVIAFSVVDDTDDDAFETAIAADDFFFHLGKARETLTAAGVVVYPANTRVFRVVSSTRIRLVRAKGRAPVFGYCFISPNRPPHLLYGVQTYSDLFVQACREFKLASATCR